MGIVLLERGCATQNIRALEAHRSATVELMRFAIEPVCKGCALNEVIHHVGVAVLKSLSS